MSVLKWHLVWFAKTNQQNKTQKFASIVTQVLIAGEERSDGTCLRRSTKRKVMNETEKCLQLVAKQPLLSILLENVCFQLNYVLSEFGKP